MNKVRWPDHTDLPKASQTFFWSAVQSNERDGGREGGRERGREGGRERERERDCRAAHRQVGNEKKQEIG